MTIKLALVQPNYQVGPTALNAYYLPYSVGVLWSYAKNNISVQCEVTDWVFRRDPIVETAKKLARTDIVALSCYIWNRNYSYKLAELIKGFNPNTLIVMGGPEPPITNPKLFELLPDIDIIVKQEGEKAFAEILNKFHNKEQYKNIPGLLINVDQKVLDTGDSLRLEENDMIYSPYLEGVFDNLMKENPDIEWNCILETNRGCPYMCTFCDWGGLTYSKIKKIQLQRVFDELEWMGKNKIGATALADANFGIFVERDNLIADKILEVQEKYGYPYRMGTSWAKNQKSEVIAIAKKLMGGKFNNGLTISVQSMDDNTLETIKRNNLEINKIGEIYAEANKLGLPVSTELILPLPGETLKSWKHGIVELLNLGQHNGVEVAQTQTLENTELNLVQRNIHKIKTIEAFGYMNNSQIHREEEYPESIAIITETRTMPKTDVISAYMYYWLISTFHVSGLTQLYARFLKKSQDIGYDIFYEKLENYLKNNDWYINARSVVESVYSKWLEDGQPNFINVGPVGLNHLVMPYHTVMTMHHLEKQDQIHSLIDSFIKEEFNIEKAILKDLQELTRNYVVTYSKVLEFPKKIKLSTNCIKYIFEDLDKISYGDYVGHCNYTEDVTLPQSVFLENLFFARRRAFGKTVIKQETNVYNATTVEAIELTV